MLCLNVHGANMLWSLFILLENVNFWFSSIEQIWGFCDNKPKKNNKTKPKPRLKLPWGCLWFMYGEWVFLFIYLFIFLGLGFWEMGLVLLLWSHLDLSSSSSLLLLHPVCFFSPLLQFYGNSSSTWIILSTSAWNSSV